MCLRAVMISVILVTAAEICSAKDWHGIVPLKSTRVDVERMLGPSDSAVMSIYRLRDEIVSIEFSKYSCNSAAVEGWPRPPSTDWNVPPDTVLAIRVAPRKQIRLSELSIDLTTFKKVPGDKDLPAHLFYVDEEDGFSIEVFSDLEGSREIVRSFIFQPRIKDRPLRCPAKADGASDQ